MTAFKALYDEFERTHDIAGFTEKYRTDHCGIRFLLLRSLDNPNLIEIMQQKGQPCTGGKFVQLLEQAYNSSISVDEALEYIESKRDEIDATRNKAEEGLQNIIENYGKVNCGLRNDKVDDIVKALVRDKSIKSIDALKDRIRNEITPRIQNYILWSFYNQTTNDLIEHYFIKHKKVIPTLRKIHDIDFFLKTGDAIIPFDLKITHIAEDFFDLYAKGLLENGGTDSFVVNAGGTSEIEAIKEFYKSRKKQFALPNYSDLSKKELLELLQNTGDPKAKEFVESMYRQRSASVSRIASELKKLEWWNFKYQGERLFSNNNRLFIFLAYINAFEDARPIKGKLEKIRSAVNQLLDSAAPESINTLHYHYDKEASLVGDYTVKSLSVLITDTYDDTPEPCD